MPRFSYTAKEAPTKVIHGVIEAESIDQAIHKVIQSGLTPLDVFPDTQKQKESSSKNPFPSFRLSKKIPIADMVIFSRQLSDLVDASVPILRTLEVVANQTQNSQLKGTIKDIHKFVQDGSSFADALGKYPDIFSRFYVNMVRTGELGGELGIVLNRLSSYLEKEQETRSKIKSSLAYPVLICVVGILTVFVLLTFVIPRLAVMFDDLGQALPLPTLILMAVSDFFAKFWWLIIGTIGLSIFYLKRQLDAPEARLKFDAFLLNLPLLGNFIKTAEVGHFSMTLGTLLESGITLTTALNAVWPTVNNSLLKEEIKGLSREVSNGSSLRAALKQCVSFPEAAVNMISVGEETGRLDQGLFKVAATFERQTDQITKTMISLLGPVVLVCVVVVIGFVMIAMLLPIFSMNLAIQ